MGRIIKLRVNWTGLQGGNGYSNFHFEPVPEDDPITQATVDAAVAKVQPFLTSIKPYLPSYCTTGIDASVLELDEQTGNIEAFWNATPAAPAAGTSVSGSHSAVSGLCINWGTGGVRKNRRVRGRTFIVPLGASGLDTNGTIDNTALGVIRTAANALHVDSNGVRLVIYARTPGALIPDGGAYDVISSTINDKPAILTSRRA